MDEETIQNQLKQNIPQAPEPAPIVPSTPEPVGQAETAMPLELDELTVYKLHDFFGEHYSPTNEEAKAQVTYIYEKLGQIMGEQDYGLIIQKARELERLIGTTNGEKRMYKLYRWLKLDSIRRSTEAQMNALGG